MAKFLSLLLGIPLVGFAAFSSSGTYQLNSYGIGSGGTNSASSGTYDLQGNAGEQTNRSTSSSTYTANNGAVQTEQLNIPPAPTLSNGSGTYYNKLSCIVNTGGNPSDATYAIMVDTSSSFLSPSYVQADGTLGAGVVYQTYAAWGSGSGFQIVGLLPSTTYYAKAAAKQGMFTNTAFSTSANSATTASPTLSFSISPNSASLGSFVPNVITSSSNISFTFSTNGTSGGNIYVRGENGGFTSLTQGYTISAVSADLTTQSEGFGIQAANPNQTSGGPFATVSPYNGTGNTVGAETTSFIRMLTSASPITGGTATATVQVKASGTTPASNDYSETFTFIASASF